MSRRLLMVTEDDDITWIRSETANCEEIILLCWSAPESLAALSTIPTGGWALNRLANSYDELVGEAFALAHRVAVSCPPYRGAKPLLAWENNLADSMLHIAVLARAFEQLRQSEGSSSTEFVFAGPSPAAKVFNLLNELCDSGLTIRCLSNEDRRPSWVIGRLKALRAATVEARLDRDWMRVPSLPVEVLDSTYRLRSRRHLARPARRNARWCYSSYVNYSRILSRHAETADAGWVTNSYSSRAGLAEGIEAIDLWRFGRTSPPAHYGQVTRRVREHLESAPSPVSGVTLGRFFNALPALPLLTDRVVPIALAETDLFHAFLEQACPEEIWVANQWASEGTLIDVAHHHGTQVVQVQHGILEHYYPYSSIYSDRFLVWGQFWRDCLQPKERNKVSVVNPGLEVRARSTADVQPGHLTFFTAPTSNRPFWHADLAQSEAMQVLSGCLQKGRDVTIRVHPRDRIALWKRAWTHTTGSPPSAVSFDKGGGIEKVLAGTNSALTYLSSVLLNCIRSDLPVVSLGWYPSIWRDPLERHGLVRFASSINEAISLTSQECPGLDHAAAEQFLASPATNGRS